MGGCVIALNDFSATFLLAAMSFAKERSSSIWAFISAGDGRFSFNDFDLSCPYIQLLASVMLAVMRGASVGSIAI